MSDTRAIPCTECGGDGGWDVPHDIDRRDGSLITHWRPCSCCAGTGSEEIKLEPVTEEEIMGCPECGASCPERCERQPHCNPV